MTQRAGGRFVRDPNTGERVHRDEWLARQAAPAADPAPVESAPEPPPETPVEDDPATDKARRPRK